MIKRLSDLCGWDTRTRTKNGRTRICSVTITPYPNFLFCSPNRDCECKGTHFFEVCNFLAYFFLKKLQNNEFLGYIRQNYTTFVFQNKYSHIKNNNDRNEQRSREISGYNN